MSIRISHKNARDNGFCCFSSHQLQLNIFHWVNKDVGNQGCITLEVIGWFSHMGFNILVKLGKGVSVNDFEIENPQQQFKV